MNLCAKAQGIARRDLHHGVLFIWALNGARRGIEDQTESPLPGSGSLVSVLVPASRTARPASGREMTVLSTDSATSSRVPA
jgi:hypothetical protein